MAPPGPHERRWEQACSGGTLDLADPSSGAYRKSKSVCGLLAIVTHVVMVRQMDVPGDVPWM